MRHRNARRNLTVTLALAALAGCSVAPPSAPTGTLPGTSPGSGPTNTWTVKGTVFVHQLNGVTPAASGAVFGWIANATGGRTTGRLSIDADGHYQFFVPYGTTRVHVMGPSYQPCAVSRAITGDVTMDVNHVADARLLGASIPAVLSAQQPTISGMVYEHTPDGRRALANVHVELDGLDGLGLVIANTLTDAEGRYVLCGVPAIRGLVVLAALTGYQLFYSSGELMGVTTLDIEMRRQLPSTAFLASASSGRPGESAFAQTFRSWLK